MKGENKLLLPTFAPKALSPPQSNPHNLLSPESVLLQSVLKALGSPLVGSSVKGKFLFAADAATSDWQAFADDIGSLC